MLYKFNVMVWEFDKLIDLKVFTTAKQANEQFFLFTWLPFLMTGGMRIFKIYSPDNFQIHNAVLLTVVTVLYSRSPRT